MIKEEWKSVKDYEGIYEISNHGRIRSYCRTRRKILKLMYHYKGHTFIHLCKDGIRRKFFIHRLVAIAFIPNPENKPLVDHKDEKKDNNYIWNLQWCDESENTKLYYERRNIIINPEGLEF